METRYIVYMISHPGRTPVMIGVYKKEQSALNKVSESGTYCCVEVEWEL